MVIVASAVIFGVRYLGLRGGETPNFGYTGPTSNVRLPTSNFPTSQPPVPHASSRNHSSFAITSRRAFDRE
jgi:hypothetical protein